MVKFLFLNFMLLSVAFALKKKFIRVSRPVSSDSDTGTRQESPCVCDAICNANTCYIIEYSDHMYCLGTSETNICYCSTDMWEVVKPRSTSCVHTVPQCQQRGYKSFKSCGFCMKLYCAEDTINFSASQTRCENDGGSLAIYENKKVKMDAMFSFEDLYTQHGGIYWIGVTKIGGNLFWNGNTSRPVNMNEWNNPENDNCLGLSTADWVLEPAFCGGAACAICEILV